MLQVFFDGIDYQQHRGLNKNRVPLQSVVKGSIRVTAKGSARAL